MCARVRRCTRYDATGQWRGRDNNLLKILPFVDYFLPSDQEAMSISRTSSVVRSTS